MNNLQLPIVTLRQINDCKDEITLVKNIPPYCKCDSEETFLKLRERYTKANISFVADREKLTINS